MEDHAAKVAKSHFVRLAKVLAEVPVDAINPLIVVSNGQRHFIYSRSQSLRFGKEGC